jgi:hypothetical protein
MRPLPGAVIIAIVQKITFLQIIDEANPVKPYWRRLRRFCPRGWLVMTKLSRAVSACILAIMMLLGAASIAAADTFTYELNGSFAESNGGPSLVPLGGTLGPTGYNFGVNQGLSLSGTGAFDAYSIDIRFYFDDVNASTNTFQKILDFKNRTSDSGLYSVSGQLVLFATSGSGDPNAGTQVHDFTNGTLAELVVTRSANGLFSASVVGHGGFSVMDTNGATTFSGPGNIINFFMDDLLSFSPEASTGFIDRIQVTTPAAAVPIPNVGAGWPGLVVAFGLLTWWRRRRKIA